MWGENDAAERARAAVDQRERQGQRAAERRRRKAEQRARRLAEQEKRRQEDAQLLAQLVEKMTERGTLQTVAAEIPSPLNRGFGFSQPVQVSPSAGVGRAGAKAGTADKTPAPPPIVLKKPM